MRITKIKDNFKEYHHIKSNLIAGSKRETPPVYSILIPTFQRYKLLKEAIDSALDQKGHIDYEVMIVDNDPTSNHKNESLIKSYSAPNLLYYRNEKNIGMIGNWNRCVELANGKWITFLHDDDLLFPNYLIEMHSAISKFPQIYLFAPSAFIQKNINNPFLNSNNTKRKYVNLKIKDFFYSNLVPTQGTMFLRQNCIDLGGYNDDLFPGSDYVFWINYISKYNGIKLSQTLFSYRIIENETFRPETFINSIKNIYMIRKELSILLKIPTYIAIPFLNFGLISGINTANTLPKCKIDKSEMLKKYKINKIWGTLLAKIFSKIFLRILLKTSNKLKFHRF